MVCNPINTDATRIRVNNMVCIDPITITNDTINEFDLKVTATHQYKNQSINISSIYKESNTLLGKYQFVIDDNIVIPYNEENINISNINFDIPNLNSVSFGAHKCYINYIFENGTKYYLDFEILKETNKREIVERTFKRYDGGYTGEKMDAGYTVSKYPCFLVPRDQISTIITTTEATNIPVEKYAGILGVNIDAGGAHILMSFDKRETWVVKGIDGLIPVFENEISEKGMTPEDINNITHNEWVSYKPKSLDFKIYLDNTKSVDNSGYGVPSMAYLRSITVTLPPNNQPEIRNIILTPEILHIGSVNLSGSIIDPEGDEFTYRILLNGEELTPWSDISINEQLFNLTIPSTDFYVGTNSLKIEATDDDKLNEKYYYVSKTNVKPLTNAILNGNLLTATIGDEDNDKVKYRILLNDIVVKDWSELLQSPISIKYELHQKDVIIGSENTLIIEAMDELEESSICDIGFIGTHYSLIFKDLDDNILSDSYGNTIKLFDLGSIVVKGTSSPVPVKVVNTTGHKLNNLIIETTNADSVDTLLSLDQFNFVESTNSISIPGEMEFDDSVIFYVKCLTENTTKGSKMITVNAKADIVETLLNNN